MAEYIDASKAVTLIARPAPALTNPRIDNVLATTADIHITAGVDTGTTFWAVFNEHSNKTAAEIRSPAGAEDSGDAPSQLIEDTFTVTGLDTENFRYYVWFAHTDSVEAVNGGSFGAAAGMFNYYHNMRRKSLA